MPRKKAPLVADVLKQLAADPDYQRRMRDRERFMEKRLAKAARIAAPVIADLRKAGFPVSGIGDLWLQGMNYRTAVPILLDWLQRTNDLGLKEGIARALATTHARPEAARPLLDEFIKLTDNKVKWVIGNALDVVADDSYFEELLDIAKDRRHGSARQMVVIALGKMHDPRGVDVLVDLLDDEDVVVQAIWSLGNLRAIRAKPRLEALLASASPPSREELRRALSKIETAERRAAAKVDRRGASQER